MEESGSTPAASAPGGTISSADSAKPGGGRKTALDFHVHRELDLFLFGAGADRHPLQFHIAPPQNIDNHRIEALARFGDDDLHGLIERQRPAVLPVGSQRIQAIHHRENARADRNLFTRKAERIARSIPFFVVRADDRNHRIGEFDLFQNFRPHQRMDLHLLEFFRRQPAGLGNDVLGHRQFADIVQQRRRLQSVQFLLAQTDFLADLGGINPHALQMIGVVASLASIASASASMVRRWSPAISSTCVLSFSSRSR